MKKILLWACLGLTLWTGAAQAAISAADKEVLPQLAASMNSANSLQADFSQVAPDGTRTHGVFSMRRPGKAAFVYAPPTPTRVVSDGFWVVIENRRTKTQDRYPLDSTPLSLLFGEKISFDSPKVLLEDVIQEPDSISVTMRLAKTPEQGTLTLMFSKVPKIELLGWIVRDAQDQVTKVTLDNTVVNTALDNRLFYIDNNKAD